MASNFWTNLIGAIHRSGAKIAIAITGGGAAAIGKLLEVPGGSQSVLEATVPYASAALVEFLGGTPDQFCSERTARAMAMAAWVRARHLTKSLNEYQNSPSPSPSPEYWGGGFRGADPHSLVGIGVTASLVSDQPKKGEHRIHVGVQRAELTVTYSLTLNKGARSRSEEEQLAAKLVIVALAEACGVDAVAAYEQLEGKNISMNPSPQQYEKLASPEYWGGGLGETIVHHTQIAEPAWTQLLLGETKCVGCDAVPKIVFPGAFNPLHRGHVKMAELAVDRLGNAVAYELSITNVDKPPLDFVEINERLRVIREQDPTRAVLLTAAPTFVEKARLVPGATFVVGVDTVVRIADPRYYGNDDRRRDAAIAEIAHAGCRFLVFGRQVGERFCCLGDIELPAWLRALCDEVGEGEFHEDVSSTAMRQSSG